VTELENPLQYTNYGTYTSQPNDEQLKLYFTLSPSDLVFLERTRTPNSKLGMALQLTTLRFLGTFLVNPLNTPALVVNAVVVWNTDYMSAILSLLEAMGDDVLIEDLVRVTPLKTQHIKVLGEYRFDLHPDVIEGDLRPLRDPNSSIGLEDEDDF
jgi:hypothetical protein